MSTVLLTGASGFVGAATAAAFLGRGHDVRAALRAPDRPVPPGTAPHIVGEIGPETRWEAALRGVEVVVHLAARVHQMRDRALDPLAAHRAVNLHGTVRLAREAARAGARRLVFVSSVKVMGEGRERPYAESDAPDPRDPYGLSKWEAEQALAQVAGETGLEVTVLRPPLVYGPGVRANFLRMMQLVARGVPLPLGGVRNRRSLLYVGNLADALVTAAGSAAAAGQTFFASDGQDVSTPELVRAIGRALGRPARLLPVPPALLRLGAAALGKRAAAVRLLGSLAVDPGHIGERLGWRPPRTLEAGLAETAAWFREGRAP